MVEWLIKQYKFKFLAIKYIIWRNIKSYTCLFLFIFLNIYVHNYTWTGLRVSFLLNFLLTVYVNAFRAFSLVETPISFLIYGIRLNHLCLSFSLRNPTYMHGLIISGEFQKRPMINPTIQEFTLLKKLF